MSDLALAPDLAPRISRERGDMIWRMPRSAAALRTRWTCFVQSVSPAMATSREHQEWRPHAEARHHAHGAPPPADAMQWATRLFRDHIKGGCVVAPDFIEHIAAALVATEQAVYARCAEAIRAIARKRSGFPGLAVTEITELASYWERALAAPTERKEPT